MLCFAVLVSFMLCHKPFRCCSVSYCQPSALKKCAYLGSAVLQVAPPAVQVLEADPFFDLAGAAVLRPDCLTSCAREAIRAMQLKDIAQLRQVLQLGLLVGAAAGFVGGCCSWVCGTQLACLGALLYNNNNNKISALLMV